ncbi:hypothetical protein ACHAW6_010421 [Cyclotella cf. meneghiniana]
MGHQGNLLAWFLA